MYLKLSSNVLFRKYDSIGYITDNRNFSYSLTNSEKNYIGDKILSEVSSIFVSALTKKPQSIDTIVEKIHKQFRDVSIETIKNDAVDFFIKLEQDGFVVQGTTFQKCQENDIIFSYKKQKTEYKTVTSKPFNVEESTQDFFENYFDGKPQLTNAHIEIISKCNERCVHCYIPHESKLSAIDSNLFYNILEQCKEMNLLHLNLSGGEPMLHKDFCNFLKKCNEYDFSINILSNLILLDDDIIKEMKSNPLLGVQVSLYSMNPEIHDEITQTKGSFEKTKKGILTLIENDILLQISCPIMKQNKDVYKDVIKWAKDYKVQVTNDHVIIAGYDNSTTNLSCRLSLNEVKELLEYKVESNPKHLEQMKQDVENKKNILPNDIVCSVCYSSICISDNGNVYPCAGWQGYIVGNVKNTKLKDIWENSEKIQYLRNLQKKDFPKCMACLEKEFCTMCMVRNSNEHQNGDPLVVNEYFCDIAKINRDIFCSSEKSVC